MTGTIAERPARVADDGFVGRAHELAVLSVYFAAARSAAWRPVAGHRRPDVPDREPGGRPACFPSTRPEYTVEPARPDDADAIAGIAGRHEPPAAAAALPRWWARRPETFAVARGADRTVAAFVQIAELGAVDPILLDGDPAARPWLDHLGALPPATGCC